MVTSNIRPELFSTYKIEADVVVGFLIAALPNCTSRASLGVHVLIPTNPDPDIANDCDDVLVATFITYASLDVISKVAGTGVKAGRFGVNDPELRDAVDIAVLAPTPIRGDLTPCIM